MNIWHIIGAVIFWGTLYPKKICDKSISTYLFISLIIKLLYSSYIFYKKYRNKYY